eukprot:gnl/MRDRNA2_/MRDRNA2_85789_c0_seq1.p1 gnl/MRDRNA2_/MRDRNA2_85789_c0~~gnl/MRDRNA2_/MRDRNA2_85789_c0_seq1.p1  ORF type:complete len:117 (+),score=6.14 gnl/MRDRNA2_/MRDRNA2_85789_c0_seq1:93-443(+)
MFLAFRIEPGTSKIDRKIALGRSWTLLGTSWRQLGRNHKKNLFWGSQLGRQNGAKNHEKSTSKNNMFPDTLFYLFFMIFAQFLNPNFDVFWVNFCTQDENIDFVKFCISPRREHEN